MPLILKDLPTLLAQCRAYFRAQFPSADQGAASYFGQLSAVLAMTLLEAQNELLQVDQDWPPSGSSYTPGRQSSTAALDQAAEAYLAGTDPRTPYASPVFGDLSGLPPIRVDVGSDEVLFDDSRTLVDEALAAGCTAELHEWPEMIHVFQAFPTDLVPEAGEAVAAMGAFLARHLDAAGS